jgi:hypothetical protein
MQYQGKLLGIIMVALLLLHCADDNSNDGNAPGAADDTTITVPNTAVAVEVTANDTATTGAIDRRTVRLASGPRNGTATVAPATGVVTYAPTADFTGTDTFTYTVNNTQGQTSNPATVTVTVTDSPDFRAFVQLILAMDANSEPVPVNNLLFDNQFDDGAPLAVAEF